MEDLSGDNRVTLAVFTRLHRRGEIGRWWDTMHLNTVPTQVGRYHLGALVQADDDIHIYRATDLQTSQPVRLALLDQTPYTAGGQLSPTRQQFTVEAAEAQVLEAGTWQAYSFLVLAAPSADPEIVATPANALRPPITLWVRVRPFAAAFALVLATLVGLHIWDGVDSTHDEATTAQGPLFWGGAPGVSLSLIPTRTPRPAPTQAVRIAPQPLPTVIVPQVAQADVSENIVSVERIPITEPEPLTITVVDAAPPADTPAATPAPRPTTRPATTLRTQPGNAAPIVQAPRSAPAPAPVYRPPSVPSTAPRPAPVLPPKQPPAQPATGSWAAPVKAPNAWKRD